MPRAAVVLVERRDTRYSVNALLAALDAARIETYVVKWGGGVEELVERLVSRGYRVVVGVPLLTEHVARELEEIRLFTSKLSRLTGVLLVAGGPHATGDPAGTIRSLGFHVAAVGEGEETLPLLAEAWGEKGWDGVADIRGIVYEVEGRLVYTGKRRPINLDDYWSFPWWRRRFSPIEITRGCPWGCRYCETWFIHGGRERHRSIESIVEHAKAMREHGLRDARFITPNALGYGESGRGGRRLDLVEELLSKVSSLGLRVFYGSFPSEVRPEYVDDEAARLIARYAANRRVIVGGQSGSERILKVINRGHSVEDVINAVEALARHGLRPEVDFIFGLPGETREDQEETLALMKKIVEIGGRVHAHTFMPLPGTPFENAPPGRIPGWLRREIAKLIGVGGLYGQWEKQEEIAARIHELYAKHVILGLRGWRMVRLEPGRV